MTFSSDWLRQSIAVCERLIKWSTMGGPVASWEQTGPSRYLSILIAITHLRNSDVLKINILKYILISWEVAEKMASKKLQDCSHRISGKHRQELVLFHIAWTILKSSAQTGHAPISSKWKILYQLVPTHDNGTFTKDHIQALFLLIRKSIRNSIFPTFTFQL